MEKSELLTQLKEVLKSDPNFRSEVMEEIEKISNSGNEKEIDTWVQNTKTKTY